MKVVRNLKLRVCVLSSLILIGCIKEDLEICVPQTVSFSFAFIPLELCAEQVLLPEAINRLTVFVFDKSGRFVHQVDTIPTGTDYGLELLLEPDFYQFVAIANYTDQQLGNAPFVPGVTRLDDASVATFLEQRDGTLLSAKEVLYFGSDTLTVVPEASGQELKLLLVQRTKTLDIHVDGIATDRYQIVLADNAAHYTFDEGQVYLMGRPPVFVPIRKEEELYLGTAQINWPLNNDGNYTRFQIIDPKTGRRLVDEPFYELLQRVPGLVPECADRFDIDIGYRANGKVIIFINDWKVYDDHYILI